MPESKGHSITCYEGTDMRYICVVLSIHNPGGRRGWVIITTPRSLYSRGRDPVPIVQDVVWPRDRVVRVRNVSPSPGFEPRTVQPLSESVYRLGFPGRHGVPPLLQYVRLLGLLKRCILTALTFSNAIRILSSNHFI